MGNFNLKEYQKQYQRNRQKNKPESYIRWLEDNKEKIKNYQKEYRQKNKERRVEYNKINAEKLKKQKAQHHLNNKDKYNSLSKDWYFKNIDRKKQYIKDNKEKFSKIFNDRRRERYSSDINYKIATNLRNRIKSALRRKSNKSKSSTLLGCSIQELKLHLESKFKQGMSWDNYNYRGWHIDHIKPCASFDLTKLEEQKKCFHYTNMQPLWAFENLSKGAKL